MTTYFVNKPVIYSANPVTGGLAPETHEVMWTFDDGSTATGLMVRKTWTSSGLHTATATARNIITGGTTTLDKITLFVEYAAAPKSATYFRYNHTTSALPDGRLLTTGGNEYGAGVVGNYAPPYNVSVFNPVQGRALANQFLPEFGGVGYGANLKQAQHAVLVDGRLLIAGSGVMTLFYDYTSDTITHAGRYGTINGTYGWLFQPGNVLQRARATWFLTTLTALSNGKALMAGGTVINEDPAYATELTMLYDPAGETLDIDVTPNVVLQGGWTAGPPMAYPRAKHRAVTLRDGRVLVCGGNRDTGDVGYPTSPGYVYAWTNHPRAGWSSMPAADPNDPTDPMPNPFDPGDSPTYTDDFGPGYFPPQDRYREHLSRYETMINAGYVFLGWNTTRSAEIYNPQTNSWTTVAPMHHGRTDFTATLLPNGKVLVCGGVSRAYAAILDGHGTGYVSTWPAGVSAVPHNLPAGTYRDPNTEPVPGYVFDGGSSAEIYDPVANTWTLTGRMLATRHGHTATLLDDGRVLVTGGESFNPYEDEYGLPHYNGIYYPGEQAGNSVNTTELYDPDTGTWSAGPTMEKARKRHQATKMDDGKVFISAGMPGESVTYHIPYWGGTYTYTRDKILASTELFDPTNNTIYHTPPGLLILDHADTWSGSHYANRYSKSPYGYPTAMVVDAADTATVKLQPGNITVYPGFYNYLILNNSANFFIEATENSVTQTTATQRYDSFVGVQLQSYGSGTMWSEPNADAEYTLLYTNTSGAAVTFPFYLQTVYDVNQLEGSIHSRGVNGFYTVTLSPGDIPQSYAVWGGGDVTVHPTAPTDYYLDVAFDDGLVHATRRVGPMAVVGSGTITSSPSYYYHPSQLRWYAQSQYPSPVYLYPTFLWGDAWIDYGPLDAYTGLPVNPNLGEVLTANAMPVVSGGSYSINPRVDTIVYLMSRQNNRLFRADRIDIYVPISSGTVSLTGATDVHPGDNIVLTPHFPRGTGRVNPGNIPVTDGNPVTLPPPPTNPTTYSLTVTPPVGDTDWFVTNLPYTPVTVTRDFNVVIDGYMDVSAATFAAPGDPIDLTAHFTWGTAVITPGDIPILNNETITVHPTDTTTYTLTVTYLTYTAVDSREITYAPPPVTVSIVPNDYTLGRSLTYAGDPSRFVNGGEMGTPPAQMYDIEGTTGQTIILSSFGESGTIITIADLADNIVAQTTTGAYPTQNQRNWMYNQVLTHTFATTEPFQVEVCSFINTDPMPFAFWAEDMAIGYIRKQGLAPGDSFDATIDGSSMNSVFFPGKKAGWLFYIPGWDPTTPTITVTPDMGMIANVAAAPRDLSSPILATGTGAGDPVTINTFTYARPGDTLFVEVGSETLGNFTISVSLPGYDYPPYSPLAPAGSGRTLADIPTINYGDTKTGSFAAGNFNSRSAGSSSSRFYSKTWKFSGTIGDSLHFATTTTNYMNLVLMDEAFFESPWVGTAPFEFTTYTGTPGSQDFVLPATGTYYLEIYDTWGENASDYTLTLTLN